MKKASLLPFTLLLSLIACKQATKNNYDKLIIGDWIYKDRPTYKKVPDFFWGHPKQGYVFYPGGICENKWGYFKRQNKNQSFESRVNNFLGTETTYKIEDDHLKIYNLSDSTWKDAEIARLNSEELLLIYNDSSSALYSKLHDTIEHSVVVDEIIISSTGCYGTCPISDMRINKMGDVVYYGQQYNTQNGFFKSDGNEKIFSKIEMNFKKADFENLKCDYTADMTDNEEVDVTFIKANKILKTISDYGGSSTTPFVWAYSSARYAYQKMKLDTMPACPDYLKIVCLRFKDKSKIVGLKKSENFYLLTLLLKSKEVEIKFKSTYQLIYYQDGDDKTAETDGRYYTFVKKNGKSVTLDLGFNFIEKNNL